ncbi:MAG: hypothetical protein ABIM50_03655 [Novosphingobium sp.]
MTVQNTGPLEDRMLIRELFGFLSEIGWIAVDGDKARASSQAREIIRLKDGGLFKLIGHSNDELVRENGQ